jgi:hypothetical protein
MTTKNKKIILGTSVGVIAASVIYLLYKRSVNKKNSQLMLEFISEIPKTNTTSAVQDLGNKITYSVLNQIDTTDMKKIPTKEFIVDKTTYKSISDLNKTGKMNEIVKDINKAVSSIKGTDTDLFFKSFARLGNRSAMIFANTLYKSLYKETMWDAIKGETALYNSDLKKNLADPFNIAGLTDYNINIVNYLNYIKDK